MNCDNNGSEPLQKKQRIDRSIKLKERSHHKETVVKCTLNSVLIGSKEYKDVIRNSINIRVSAYSQRAVKASRALGLIIRQMIAEETDLANPINTYNCISDQTFIRQLMIGTDRCSVEHPRIKQLFDYCPELFYDKKLVKTKMKTKKMTTIEKNKSKLDERSQRERYLGDRNIYSAAGIKIIANIWTHLKVNIIKVIKKAVYKCAPGTKEEQVEILFSICGWKRNIKKKKPSTSKKRKKDDQPPPESVITLGEEQHRFVRTCRHILGLDTDDTVLDDAWIDKKKNAPNMLLFFAHTLRMLEANEGEKLFALIPMIARKRHFITIDTSVLYGIARDTGMIGPTCSDEAFAANGLDHWASLLDFKKHLPGSKLPGSKLPRGKFTGTIETDGISVCIHYTRPLDTPRVGKKTKPVQLERPSKEIRESSRIISIDPGRSNIIYAVEVLKDGTFRKSRFTRRQYYTESGINKANKQVQSWHNKYCRAHIDAMSKVSSKGVSLDTYKAFLKVDHVHGPGISNEHMKKRWAEQRLRLYGGKKRAIACFFNRMLDGRSKHGKRDDRPVLVAYGSAKLASGGKGEVCVPVSGVFHACKDRVPTYIVDEWRSTRISYTDDSILGYVGTISKEKDKEDTVRQVRGLLWGQSTNQTNGKFVSKFVNRDLNGALNIHRCFLLEERPAMLDRAKCRGDGPLSKTIKKIIDK